MHGTYNFDTIFLLIYWGATWKLIAKELSNWLNTSHCWLFIWWLVLYTRRKYQSLTKQESQSIRLRNQISSIQIWQYNSIAVILRFAYHWKVSDVLTLMLGWQQKIRKLPNCPKQLTGQTTCTQLIQYHLHCKRYAILCFSSIRMHHIYNGMSESKLLIKFIDPKNGPVVSITTVPYPSFWRRCLWHSTAKLNPVFNLQDRAAKIFDTCSGGGWSSNKEQSQCKAITEAIERWSYNYYSEVDPHKAG